MSTTCTTALRPFGRVDLQLAPACLGGSGDGGGRTVEALQPIHNALATIDRVGKRAAA